jgi:hypothetical protein
MITTDEVAALVAFVASSLPSARMELPYKRKAGVCRRFFAQHLVLRLTAREKRLNSEIGYLNED